MPKIQNSINGIESDNVLNLYLFSLMKSLFSELEFPLPLSDYSRGKALHAYKRALLEGNVAIMVGIERLATQDEELRHSLELTRAPLDGASPADGATPRLSRVEMAAPPPASRAASGAGLTSGGLPSLEEGEDGQLPKSASNKDSR